MLVGMLIIADVFSIIYIYIFKDKMIYGLLINCMHPSPYFLRRILSFLGSIVLPWRA